MVRMEVNANPLNKPSMQYLLHSTEIGLPLYGEGFSQIVMRFEGDYCPQIRKILQLIENSDLDLNSAKV